MHTCNVHFTSVYTIVGDSFGGLHAHWQRAVLSTSLHPFLSGLEAWYLAGLTVARITEEGVQCEHTYIYFFLLR